MDEILIDLIARAKGACLILDGIADGDDDPAAKLSDWLAEAIRKADPDDAIKATEPEL